MLNQIHFSLTSEDTSHLKPFLPSVDSTGDWQLFIMPPIPHMSDEVLMFLERNPETYMSLPLFEELSGTFRSLNVDATGEMRLIHDVESPDWEGLVFEFKIKNKSYPEILELWDKVTQEEFKKLDPRAAKKIEIILSRE